MKLNEMIKKREYVRVDFDKVLSIKEIEGIDVTIVNRTKIKTMYGEKNVVIFEDGTFIYLTKGLEGLMTEELPFTTKIFMKKSKKNKSYWTYDKNYKYENAKLVDFVGCEIELEEVNPVSTKYGDKVRINFVYENTRYSAIASCTFLLKIADTIYENHPIAMVVERVSKNGNTYVTLE